MTRQRLRYPRLLSGGIVQLLIALESVRVFLYPHVGMERLMGGDLTVRIWCVALLSTSVLIMSLEVKKGFEAFIPPFYLIQSLLVFVFGSVALGHSLVHDDTLLLPPVHSLTIALSFMLFRENLVRQESQSLVQELSDMVKGE